LILVGKCSCIDDSQQEEYLTKDGRRKVRIFGYFKEISEGHSKIKAAMFMNQI
jgi:hypothetical protein